MKLWKLLDFVICYSVSVFPAEVKYFVKNFNQIISGTASGFESSQGWGSSGMTNHHVRVVTALVNAPFVCPIFWEFATNLSLILYPNHRLFWESKLISSNQAIILTVIVLTFKDYESFWVTKSLTLLAPPGIPSQFWTHFEARERISEVESLWLVILECQVFTFTRV